MSIFKSNVLHRYLKSWIRFLQRVRSHFQTFTKCEIANGNVPNVSDLEPKIYKESKLESKLHIVSNFESNCIQRGTCQNRESTTSCQIRFQNSYNDVRLWWENFATCQIWNEKITKCDILKKITVCQMLNQKVYVPKFDTKDQLRGRFWNKQLQRFIIQKENCTTYVSFLFKIITKCHILQQNITARQILKQNLYNVSRFISDDLQCNRFWKERFTALLYF